MTVAEPIDKDRYLKGTVLTFETGRAAGKSVNLGYFENNRLYIGDGGTSANEVIRLVSPGDKVSLDNSDYIAIQTYHRHQVPSADFKVWDQFRDQKGSPRYPQRPAQICYGFASSGCGSIQSGDFHGKMICLSSLADDSAFPWMADWYRQKTEAAKGKRHQAVQDNGVFCQ